MFRPALLAVALLLAPFAASAQRAANTQWDLSGGLAVMRATNPGAPADYDYGWTASLANRPYKHYPWVGGVIEGTGIYTRSTSAQPGLTVTTNSNTYMLLAGPVVVSPFRGPRPFAHVLLGGLIVDQTASMPFQSIQSTNDYFLQALGGGVDFPAGKHVLVRTQADWVHAWQYQTNNDDSLRLIGGVVYTF